MAGRVGRTLSLAGGTAAGDGPVLGPRVADLLARSDAELVAADLAPDPEARFLHAHLAALKAAAAVVAAHEGPARRRAPRPVWELVSAAVPELAGSAATFAAAAPLRAAVETGRSGVGEPRADRAVAEATAFADEVRDLLLGFRATALRVS